MFTRSSCTTPARFRVVGIAGLGVLPYAPRAPARTPVAHFACQENVPLRKPCERTWPYADRCGGFYRFLVYGLTVTGTTGMANGCWASASGSVEQGVLNWWLLARPPLCRHAFASEVMKIGGVVLFRFALVGNEYRIRTVGRR